MRNRSMVDPGQGQRAAARIIASNAPAGSGWILLYPGWKALCTLKEADRADHPTRTVSDAVLPPQIKSARTELVGGNINESAKY